MKSRSRTSVPWNPILIACALAGASAGGQQPGSVPTEDPARTALLRGLDYLAFPATYDVEHATAAVRVSSLPDWTTLNAHALQDAAGHVPSLTGTLSLLDDALRRSTEKALFRSSRFIVSHTPDYVVQHDIGPAVYTVQVGGYGAVLHPRQRSASISEGGHDYVNVCWDEQLSPVGCRLASQQAVRLGDWQQVRTDAGGYELFKVSLNAESFLLVRCSKDDGSGIRLPLAMADFVLREDRVHFDLSTIASVYYGTGPNGAIYVSSVCKLHLMGSDQVFLEVDKNRNWQRGAQIGDLPRICPGWRVASAVGGRQTAYTLRTGREIPLPLKPFILARGEKR